MRGTALQQNNCVLQRLRSHEAHLVRNVSGNRPQSTGGALLFPDLTVHKPWLGKYTSWYCGAYVYRPFSPYRAEFCPSMAYRAGCCPIPVALNRVKYRPFAVIGRIARASIVGLAEHPRRFFVCFPSSCLLLLLRQEHVRTRLRE